MNRNIQRALLKELSILPEYESIIQIGIDDEVSKFLLENFNVNYYLAIETIKDTELENALLKSRKKIDNPHFHTLNRDIIAIENIPTTADLLLSVNYLSRLNPADISSTVEKMLKASKKFVVNVESPKINLERVYKRFSANVRRVRVDRETDMYLVN